jgi:hypothetical protein
MKRLTLGFLPLAFLCMAANGGGCTSSNAAAGSACAAAGGQCHLGGFQCPASAVAPAAADDCNPQENPGGAFCCLSTDASAETPDASTPDASLPACSWPAIYDDADASTAGATGQCVAARVLLSCAGSNGGGEECGSDNLTQCPGPNATPGVTYSNCQDLCQSDEYVLFCGAIGPPPADASPTSSPPANCRMAAANPSGREPYCCSCGP